MTTGQLKRILDLLTAVQEGKPLQTCVSPDSTIWYDIRDTRDRIFEIATYPHMFRVRPEPPPPRDYWIAVRDGNPGWPQPNEAICRNLADQVPGGYEVVHVREVRP